ncbi:MAG: tRNA and rRNA cytosine-C5-methylase, partial [Ruthenibacterium lactatiformans]
MPAGLLGVRPGERVLDLCAAPGGKTSQLAAALRGEGLLVANEYVAARAGVLKSNLERMGVTNALVLNESTARVAAAFPAFFDKVLVDAPCSGEGMFRKEPEALRQHSAALVAQCAALGASILDDAAAALRPGGLLCYSTCT